MLTDYQIVNADGLRAVSYEGTEYPLDQINDKIAEKLYGRTHIIEKVARAEVVAPAEVPAPTRARRSEA